jgi:CheY-like chemotaxis protein
MSEQIVVQLPSSFVALDPWPHNRAQWPKHHVIVCEDNLEAQSDFASLFARLFGPDGSVQVSFAPGAAQAICLLMQLPVSLVIVDQDMPWGNGVSVVEMMKKFQPSVPVMTASGISANNVTLQTAGATHVLNKWEFFDGTRDALLRTLLA